MLQDKFIDIERVLSTRFINREDEIRGLTLAALSRKNIEFLGPPGTAKSMLVKAYSQYLDAKHFRWLLTQYTSPDEIFGPVSIKALKEDSYQRVPTGKLPEAQIAFLDEIYKASSAILNTLLNVLEERVWQNNGSETKLPLMFCAGASNELPPEDEGLAALRDRFLLRFVVGYLGSREQFSELLHLRANGKVTTECEHITSAELVEAHEEVSQLTFHADALDALAEVWEQLRDKGVFISDRRYIQTMDVMAAHAWLLGDECVGSDSIIVAENIFWEKPEQIKDVKLIVRSCVNPGQLEAESLLADALEAVKSLLESTAPADMDIIQIRRQLMSFRETMRGIKQTAKVLQIAATLDIILTVLLEVAMKEQITERVSILAKLMTQLSPSQSSKAV